MVWVLIATAIGVAFGVGLAVAYVVVGHIEFDHDIFNKILPPGVAGPC